MNALLARAVSFGVVVGAIGDAIADDFAGFVAVFAHAEHAGGEDRNVAFLAAGLSSAGTNFLFCPVVNSEVEAGTEDDAVGRAACELQAFRSLG